VQLSSAAQQSPRQALPRRQQPSPAGSRQTSSASQQVARRPVPQQVLSPPQQNCASRGPQTRRLSQQAPPTQRWSPAQQARSAPRPQAAKSGQQVPSTQTWRPATQQSPPQGSQQAALPGRSWTQRWPGRQQKVGKPQTSRPFGQQWPA
jgi:hypothetical protein